MFYLLQASLNSLYKKVSFSFIEVNAITQYIFLYQVWFV